jgi:hypothetical protein
MAPADFRCTSCGDGSASTSTCSTPRPLTVPMGFGEQASIAPILVPGEVAAAGYTGPSNSPIPRPWTKRLGSTGKVSTAPTAPREPRSADSCFARILQHRSWACWLGCPCGLNGKQCGVFWPTIHRGHPLSSLSPTFRGPGIAMRTGHRPILVGIRAGFSSQALEVEWARWPFGASAKLRCGILG